MSRFVRITVPIAIAWCAHASAPIEAEALSGARARSALLVQVAPQDPPFIEVTGTAQVQVPADRARLSFAVVTEGASAAEVTADNATSMSAVTQALRDTGTRGLQIETFGYQLQPRYSRVSSGESPTIAGYRATNHVRATIDDVDAVGRLLDAAVAGGANRVTGLTFEARDTERASQEALRSAVASARGQAEAMAAALGLPLGPPLEVRGGAQQNVPRPVGGIALEGLARAAQDPTPVEAADQTVSAHVTLRFLLPSGGR